MLSLALILIAAGQSSAASDTPPRPLDASGWVRMTDYPSTALRSGKEGAVTFKLTIDSDGNPVGCSIVKSADAEFDSGTCDALMRNAHFEPARDVSGKAIASTYQSTVQWQLPKQPLSRFASAVTLVEGWSPSGGPYACRKTSKGRLPRVLTSKDCAPNSIDWNGQIRGDGTIMKSAVLLRTSDGGQIDWPEIEASRENRVRFDIDVDWRGVVTRCERDTKWSERPLLPGMESYTCSDLANFGKPAFEPVAEDTSLRHATIEFMETGSLVLDGRPVESTLHIRLEPE